MLSRRDRARRSVAIHEAGHAVVGIALRRRFRFVTIKPDDVSAGHVRLIAPRPGASLGKSFDFLMQSLAGYEAERAFGFKGQRRWRYEPDRRAAAEHAVDISADPTEVALWVRLAERRARALVEQWRPSIEAVAERLLADTTLPWEHAKAVALRARGVIID